MPLSPDDPAPCSSVKIGFSLKCLIISKIYIHVILISKRGRERERV